MDGSPLVTVGIGKAGRAEPEASSSSVASEVELVGAPSITRTVPVGVGYPGGPVTVMLNVTAAPYRIGFTLEVTVTVAAGTAVCALAIGGTAVSERSVMRSEEHTSEL